MRQNRDCTVNDRLQALRAEVLGKIEDLNVDSMCSELRKIFPTLTENEVEGLADGIKRIVELYWRLKALEPNLRRSDQHKKDVSRFPKRLAKASKPLVELFIKLREFQPDVVSALDRTEGAGIFSNMASDAIIKILEGLGELENAAKNIKPLPHATTPAQERIFVLKGVCRIYKKHISRNVNFRKGGQLDRLLCFVLGLIEETQSEANMRQIRQTLQRLNVSGKLEPPVNRSEKTDTRKAPKYGLGLASAILNLPKS